MLRRLSWNAMTPAEKAWLQQRGSSTEIAGELRTSIRSLVEDVRVRGDGALIDALSSHDGVVVTADGLRVTDAEFATARSVIDDDLHGAIRLMIANIRAFNTELLARRGSWQTELSPGHVVGEKVGPVDSVAVFCPSGKASYPSVLAQVATPAVVAGVPQVSVIVPPVPGGAGEIDAAVLVVAHELGLRDVYRVNGPAGVAAAAFGTDTIPAHGMVVGPGSPPVALAQLEVRAHGVDSVVLGPTESLVVADDSADVRLLAADLLNEAEHGADSTVVLVTSSATLLDAVDIELGDQAAALPDERRLAAESALGANGGAVLTDGLDESLDVANWFAAEHCQLAVADPWVASEKIEHAGELLVGQGTPFSAGNFTLGGPAALPTGGFARRAGGITVENFLKSAAIGSLSADALQAVAAETIALARHEGFPAHENAITIRGVE
ncbi:MAG: histidinol dehydrogenase [Acidimicrobiales bacterium]|nr:histidinol dehydrogenase [Acidimicrobiales bacterium]